MNSFNSASASTSSASLSSSSILKSKLSPPSKYCINCALDLSMSENESSGPGLYSLTCNSRVRSPLNPPTVETIPIPHALSTIFNVTSKTDDDASGIFGLNPKQNPFNDLSSLPICFTCYLVLSDLYRTYTEFSQLRKRNSYLADKLQELQNSSKVSKSALYPRQNKNESPSGTSILRPQFSHSQKNNSNPHRDRDRNRNSCPAGGASNIKMFRENGSTSSLLESFQIEEENVEFNFIKAEPSEVFHNESNELESTDFFLEDQSDGDDSENFKFEAPANNEGYCSDVDQDLDPLAMVTVTTNRHQNIIPQHSRVIRRRKRKPKLEGMMTYEDMVKSYIRPPKKSESQTVETVDVSSADPPRIICKDRCGKDFANRKVMLRHCKEQHCEVRPFSCDICHKRFARASHLRIHNFKVHFRDKYTDVTFERHC